jgi:cytochrome oxidase assembly protein ShyY1
MMRLPILPTLIVAAAVATMIALGLWQLRRADEKEALLAQIEARRDLAPVDLIKIASTPGYGFRRAFVECRPGTEVLGGAEGGRNLDGEPGWIFKTDCEPQKVAPDHASLLQVVAGWSSDPRVKPPVFINERFSGILVERDVGDAGFPRYVLFPDKAVAGLKPAKPPSAEAISNNHLLYAAQWFFFALAAAVIYVLALRRRQRTP